MILFDLCRLVGDRLYYGFFRKKFGLRLDIEKVRRAIQMHDVQNWFIDAHRGIGWRNIHALRWIEQSVDKNAVILDTGCGIGLNMIWLAERGFYNLHGFDIDENTVLAGNDITAEFGEKIHLYVDDGLRPRWPNTNNEFDLIMAINWTYFLDGFDLEEFFRNYRPRLRPGGFMVLECIDAVFDPKKYNRLYRYNTSDSRENPADTYKKIYSHDQVRSFAKRNELFIAKTMDLTYKLVPRKIYVLRDHDDR